jgi:hypothetical protein
MAIQWKHAAPQTRAGSAKRKMTSDAIAIFEDMSVAIDNLNLADSSEFLLKVLPSQTSAFLRRRARLCLNRKNEKFPLTPGYKNCQRSHFPDGPLEGISLFRD